MDIGIDLGTTFSVIGVKGRVDPAGDYPAGEYLPECDVTIIPSRYGELTIPSAYWRDPNDPHTFKVGSDAKRAAQQGAAPILFSKRKIGTTEAFRIGNTTLTAKDVATEILRYLKQCAEQYLGAPVRRAVITHPAYFGRNQVDETRVAAAAAGFDMKMDDEQLIMEPIAAALSFIQTDPRDPLRVLLYDLGGGTFDVTVVERREGIPTMLSFDGDPLLGGYNFDRAFIQWLLRRVRNRLKTSGRTLTLDPEGRIADLSRWAQLLQLAETVKEDLKRQRTNKVPVIVKARDILVDDQGTPIVIEDRITREEYARIGTEPTDSQGEVDGQSGPALSVPDLIETTIERSRSAIRKARLTEEQIDLVLLVGGSTYGEWVQQAMRKAFACEVRLHYSPDLCVAAGAAMKAAELPPLPTGRGDGIEIVPDVPPTSSNLLMFVTGTVRRDDGSELDAGALGSLDVLLQTPNSSQMGPAKAGTGGVVIFEDVELLEDEPSRLRFDVVDSSGQPVCTREFEVLYTSDPDPSRLPSIVPQVPKPIYLRTASGLVMIADEGEQLPTKVRRVQLEKLHNENSLELDMFQGDHKVTTVALTDLPDDVGAGSGVVLEVEITKRNVMQGTLKVLRKPAATAPSGAGALDMEDWQLATSQPVKIAFPPLTVPELQELEGMFRRLDAKRLEMIHQPEISDDRRSELGGAGGKLVRHIRALMSEELKDRQEIYRELLSLDRLISPDMSALQPPLFAFEQRLRDVRHMIAASAEGSEAVSLSARVDRVEMDGRDAYVKRNRSSWGRAFERLAKIVADVQKDEPIDHDDEPLPSTKVIKADARHRHLEPLRTQYRNQLAALQQDPAFETKFKPRGAEIWKLIEALAGEIDSISDATESKQALMSIGSVVLSQKSLIEKKIREWPHAVKMSSQG